MLFEIENPLNQSIYSFPILEIFHITGYAFAIGTVALIDFRILGFGLRKQTPAQLIQDLNVWTVWSLAVAVMSGMLLYSTDPDKYYENWAFLIKIPCLIAAIVFHFTIFRKMVLKNASAGPFRGLAKALACVSLVLWAAVVFGGTFVGI